MFHIFNAPKHYPSVYAPYYEQFNFYDGRDAWLRSIDGIPDAAVRLFSLHWLHLEVYNGGFWQYFFNDTSTSAPEAIAGFEAIGMPAVAEICQNAMDKVARPFLFNTEQRRSIVGDPNDRMDFEAMDQAFYDLADTEQTFRKLPKFVPYAEAYARTHFPEFA